jgi:hypothetical protein
MHGACLQLSHAQKTARLQRCPACASPAERVATHGCVECLRVLHGLVAAAGTATAASSGAGFTGRLGGAILLQIVMKHVPG